MNKDLQTYLILGGGAFILYKLLNRVLPSNENLMDTRNQFYGDSQYGLTDQNFRNKLFVTTVGNNIRHVFDGNVWYETTDQTMREMLTPKYAYV